MALELSSLVIKPFDRAELFRSPNFAFWTADVST